MDDIGVVGKDADWLVGGGHMAQVIKAKDWSATPLGAIESWPQSLRTTVSLVQASNSPISLAWGPGHTQIYNDGYWPICGAKHPISMGQDFRECWASAWPVIGEAYWTAWSGRSAYLEKMRMFLDRFGFLEECWFTFSFSPIADESGKIGGLFHPVTELTGQMLSERRTRTLRDLAVHVATAKNAEDALRLSAEVFADANLDVPFTALYLVDETGSQARRIALSGIPPRAAGPELISLAAGSRLWSLADAYRSNTTIHLDDIRSRLSEALGPYSEMPQHAFVLPIRQPGVASPVALVVAGVSARLTITDAYRVFYELIAGAIGTAVTNARALEEERRKAAALAELDRAKTTFFSNVSHELRTPLTLILAPLEDELAERVQPLPAARRARLQSAYRNSLRLLKLVNTLLDFSRIEAGRRQASYELVDLAIETTQLAQVFRPAIEKAGLTLTIDCPPLPDRVFVDHDMWEKIVLNLLSNALKHTQAGGISISLRWHGDHVALRVADTGVGISADELPRIFERFHRVKGTWSRSHEGTGIGLALVRELALLLGGDIEVDSTEGVGTAFTVTVKTGTDHLPPDRIRQISMPIPVIQTLGGAFTEEALRWSPDPPDGITVSDAIRPAGSAEHLIPDLAEISTAATTIAERPRVVWADDNADMRAYVTNLLSPTCDVVAVANGAAALAAVRARIPDLVLSDVMMPVLDGFELVAALRADPRTHTLPVILLSARAGAESSAIGIDAGADDYLVKPFSARELLARVRTHVALHRARREWAQQLERANQELEAFSYSVSHDLGAPLRAIDGFSQILIASHAGALDDDGRDYLQRIHAAARRMRAIIDDLFALSRVGRGELRNDTIDITAIAQRVTADLRAAQPARKVDVRIPDGLTATGDSRLVTLALENLLSNAWKFTGKRSDAQILVGREDSGAWFVRDNGAGFDMRHAESLFEPFRRLHSDAEFEGTGIGLAIVRRIVERHGGKVWAKGAVGEGATIRFTLPPRVQRPDAGH